MACELPVIVSPVGELPYIIKDNETGFLLPIDDYRKWIEKIKSLTEDEVKYIGKNARNYLIKHNFTWDRYVDKTYNLIKQALEFNKNIR